MELPVDLTLLTRHRLVVVAWHLFVLAVLIWAFVAWRDGGSVHWIWYTLFALPLLVITVSVVRMPPFFRALAYWILAAACIPTAAAGLASITGWLFVVSLPMLIWAGMRERPNEEMLQM